MHRNDRLRLQMSVLAGTLSSCVGSVLSPAFEELHTFPPDDAARHAKVVWDAILV